MTLLASVLTTILVALAILHLIWAIGFWVPIRNEAALARAVFGVPGVQKMPGAIPCALVAMALLFAAILPFDRDFPLRGLLLTLIASVFVVRGIAAYFPAWRQRFPTQPFATLDRRYYGPLCLVLGAGFFILIFGGP